MTDNQRLEFKLHTNHMNAVINTLVQLQELILVKSEQDASMSEKHLTQLDASIQLLMSSLPAEVRTLFKKMQKKDILSIVPVFNNVCTGCGLTLPVSLVYSVRAGNGLYRCNHCARILYYPEVRLRGLSKKKHSRVQPIQTGIARFSSSSLMVPLLQSNERDEAISELAFKMEKEGFVDDGARLYDEVLQREAVINTAVDHGIAFPHVRGVEGGGLTLALGTSSKGVKFDPTARTLTHIIFFIVIPTAASVFYLRLLSGLTQTFVRKEARDKLLSAKTANELWTALIKTTRSTIK